MSNIVTYRMKMKSQVIDENLKKQSDMCRLLQEAVINLCQKNYTASDVEIDGIICISFQNSYQQHVVKIHEKLNKENEIANEMDHVEFEDGNPGLVVCDLTENYNSPPTLDQVSRIYGGSKDNIFRKNPGSLFPGIKDSHRGTGLAVINANSLIPGQKLTSGTKSKRKNRTPSHIASVAKRRQDVRQDRDNYGNDGSERIQEILGNDEDNSMEFKRASLHEEKMDDEGKTNSGFILIKSEPIDGNKHLVDSAEGETTLNDQPRNEDEENSVSIIQDGTDTMYIVKNDYSYQGAAKNCPNDSFVDDMKTCPDDITGQQDSYSASFLQDSLSGNAAEDIPYGHLYHSDKHSNMQSGDLAEDENSFNGEAILNSDQQGYPPYKSTPKSFPHLKLKLTNPSRTFSNKTRSDLQLTAKSARSSGSPHGSRKSGDSSELSYKAQMDEYDKRRIYFCRYCGKGFTMKCTQMRHEKTICEGGGEANYKCDICDKFFTRSDSRLRHMIKTHKINTMNFM